MKSEQGPVGRGASYAACAGGHRNRATGMHAEPPPHRSPELPQVLRFSASTKSGVFAACLVRIHSRKPKLELVRPSAGCVLTLVTPQDTLVDEHISRRTVSRASIAARAL